MDFLERPPFPKEPLLRSQLGIFSTAGTFVVLLFAILGQPQDEATPGTGYERTS